MAVHTKAVPSTVLAVLLISTACVAQARIIAFGLSVRFGRSCQSSHVDMVLLIGSVSTLCGTYQQDPLRRPDYVALSGTQPRPVTVASSTFDDAGDEAYLLYPDQMQMAW